MNANTGEAFDDIAKNSHIYFKAVCGVNSAIRFYTKSDFVLLQKNIRGKYSVIGDKLILSFKDNTKDVFDIGRKAENYRANCDIGGSNGATLFKDSTCRVPESVALPNKTFGVVIGTYASLPFIHLHFEIAKMHYPSCRIAVVDDCSNYSKELEEICQKYGHEVFSSDCNLGHMRGDAFVFARGLKWAMDNNLSHLFKFSRRFLPKIDILCDLNSILDYEYATYSNTCDWGIRSECVLMDVKLWNARCLNALNEYIEYSARSAIPHPVAEVLYTMLCKRFYYSVSKINNRHLDMSQDHSHVERDCIMGILPFLNSSRNCRSENYLWHSCNSQDEFANIARKFGLSYEARDFGGVYPV